MSAHLLGAAYGRLPHEVLGLDGGEVDAYALNLAAFNAFHETRQRGNDARPWVHYRAPGVN